jgi:hypothetical protein
MATDIMSRHVSSYEIAKIQIDLFDAQRGKLLWADTVQTSDPGNSVSVSKDLATIMAHSLILECLS